MPNKSLERTRTSRAAQADVSVFSSFGSITMLYWFHTLKLQTLNVQGRAELSLRPIAVETPATTFALYVKVDRGLRTR